MALLIDDYKYHGSVCQAAPLHHPGYRSKFADNLKKSLPRIPFAPDFHAFAKAWKELAEFPLQFLTNDKPLSYRLGNRSALHWVIES